VEGGVEVSLQFSNTTQKDAQRHRHRPAGQPFDAKYRSHLCLASNPDTLLFGRPEQSFTISQQPGQMPAAAKL
jgi:hypothetical protein